MLTITITSVVNKGFHAAALTTTKQCESVCKCNHFLPLEVFYRSEKNEMIDC